MRWARGRENKIRSQDRSCGRIQRKRGRRRAHRRYRSGEWCVPSYRLQQPFPSACLRRSGQALQRDRSRRSCSPFRVPIARLAAAQAAIKESK